jgi:hypothetical protein
MDQHGARRGGVSSWRPSGPLSGLYVGVAIVVVASLLVGLRIALPHGSARQQQPVSGGAPISGVPPYYVALTATGTPSTLHPLDLTVRSTRTGQVLQTIKAPPPYGTFILVSGAGDGKTFVVGAQQWSQLYAETSDIGMPPYPVRLFELRLDPGTGQGALAPLPVPRFGAVALESVAISPDGSRLAVGYAGGPDAIQIYHLPDGAKRTWAVPATMLSQHPQGCACLFGISWSADSRTIAFTWTPGTTADGVYLADTVAASAGARLAVNYHFMPSEGSWLAGSVICRSSPLLSANGAYLLCGGFVLPNAMRVKDPSGRPGTVGFAEFSAGTGKLVSVLSASHTQLRMAPGTPAAGASVVTSSYLLWANPDATTVIGLLDGRAVLFAGGRTRTLPGLSLTGLPNGAWVPGFAW